MDFRRILAAHLRAAGIDLYLASLDALLAGIDAAPPGHDPDAWLDLLGQDLPKALTRQLLDRRDRLRPPAHQAADHADRLRRLRVELRDRGVEGFVLMRTDEYGSEYLPGYAERVAWLTGFTGSAAQAAVLADRATVLSDGRYTVQSGQQVDEALFERRHVVDQPLAQWLEEHLPEGARLGYDPWLAKRAEREKLEKVVAKRHGTLVALDPKSDRSDLDRIGRRRRSQRSAARTSPMPAIPTPPSGSALRARSPARVRMRWR